LKRLLPAVVPAIIALLAVGATIGVMSLRDAKRIDLGIRIVQALYQFDTLEEFDRNIEVFHALVSEEVFDRMTANNTDRVLSIYLKFRAKPCRVVVLEAGLGYVIYSLASEAIESERRFLLTLSEAGGRATDVRECELFLLPTSNDWNSGGLAVPIPDHPIYGG
jgi:hypothetical protein